MITRGFAQETVITRGMGPIRVVELLDAVCVFMKDVKSFTFKRAKQLVIFKR